MFFQNLIDIITAPSAAFTRLKEKPTILLPLLLVILLTTSTQVGYVLLTDRGFLADQQLEQVEAIFPNLTDEQREQMGQQMRNQSTLALVLNSSVGTAVVLTIILALYALYLRFVSKFSFVELGWKPWFSMVCWTSVPTLFGALASWVALLSNSNGQLPILELNALNFSNLLGLEPGGALSYLTPLHFWSFALLAMGYQNWTKKSLAVSALISLAPYIVIFGLWAIL